MALRTISVRQPFASLLLAGVKKYECRRWGPRRPGVTLVHASSGKADGMPDLRDEPLYRKGVRQAGLENEAAWTFSAILGAVEIIRIWAPEEPPSLTAMDDFMVGNSEDMYLWEVGRRWPFGQPIPCHGKLNLWRPGDELTAAIGRQLSASAVPLDRLCA